MSLIITLVAGLISVLLFWVFIYFLGSLVYYKNVKVNYTRKIGHFGLFFLPMLIVYMTGDVYGISGLLIAVPTLLFIHPRIRNKISFFRRTFLAIDRPEDRPNTVRWFYLQFLLMVMLITVLTGLSEILGVSWVGVNILIGPLISVGDGLAEPIGVRFGKHRYRCYSIFPLIRNKYYRTLEGSATVFIGSLLVLIIFQGFFTNPQFIVALITIPLTITLSEAISPHTMDQPFMAFLTGIMLFLIKLFI